MEITRGGFGDFTRYYVGDVVCVPDYALQALDCHAEAFQRRLVISAQSAGLSVKMERDDSRCETRFRFR